MEFFPARCGGRAGRAGTGAGRTGSGRRRKCRAAGSAACGQVVRSVHGVHGALDLEKLLAAEYTELTEKSKAVVIQDRLTARVIRRHDVQALLPL